MLKKIFLILILIPSLLVTYASAEDDLPEDVSIISNIIIKGNQRVTNDTILTYANISKGDPITEELIQTVIRRLYQTKYFDDISVTQEFNDLIISISEKPIVSNIIITDNAIIEDEDIISALDDVCLLYTSPSPRDGLLSRMPSSA